MSRRSRKKKEKLHRQNRENNLRKKKQKAGDKDWVNITVDINDGWADDVPLIYPENGWKPDEAELTKVEIEPLEPPKKKKLRIRKQRNINEVIKEDSQVKSRFRLKPFAVFMIIWLLLLSAAISVGLYIFYDFLERYENAYQASRSYHDMDELVAIVEARDMVAIYNLMTVKPEINEYETEVNVQNYMYALLENKTIDYTKTEKYTEDFPEYYITADGYIVAKVALRKEPDKALDYGFPCWYVSNFEFYTDAQHSVRAELPSSYELIINEKTLNKEYVYETDIPVGNESFFEGYSTLPCLEKYYIDGFYEEPSLSAVSVFATECDVSFNTSRGIYEVAFVEPDDATDFRNFSIAFACDYANFNSNDADFEVLDKYFLEDSEILMLIKAGDTRKYFASHTTSNIQNVETPEFVMYDEETGYCRVTLEQVMDIYGQETIVDIHIGVYAIKQDGEWRICALKYG